MNNNKQNDVDDHRNMLMVSKKISVFQENNLKSWAFLFFPKLKEQKVSWDFIKKNKEGDFYAGEVTFDLTFPDDTEVKKEDAQKGMDNLTACVKFLFWSETKVNIKKDGAVWTLEN